MCGIVGILSFDCNAGVWQDSIRKSVNLMSRRGPDDEGLWSDGQACILGFRRLAILDLSPAARQPMVSRDGRYALVFNGEVYNFREIRRDLEREGVTFKSTGDTEVVLHALVRWGAEGLAKLNGMFALGFYDARARRLLIARDHAGIKPLYYLESPSGFLFASQYDQVMAHPWARDRAPVAEHIALYHHLGYIPAPYAMLRGTSALEPGSWLDVDLNGHIARGRHFILPVFREPDLWGAAAGEAVDAAVTAAVKRHLVSDVPVGVFLSGGIDSPLVAAKMAAAGGASFPAFTLSTNGDCHDESADAAAYAKELRLQHHLCPITPAMALAMLDDVVAAGSEPSDDYSLFPTMLVARHAREHVKVVLSGDGGDEIFFGYTRRMAPWLQRAGQTAPGTGRTYLDSQRFVPAGWVEKLFPDLPGVPADCDLFRNEDLPLDHLAQWIRWNEFTGHLTRVLLKVDRASMHQSLEVRVPLLDREVIDVACRIDWRSCIDLAAGIGKRPLRDSLRRHVRFQTTAKRGFDVPMSDWLRGPLRPIFEDIVLPRTEIMGVPLRRDELRRQFSSHLLGTPGLGWGLWRLLSLCLWETRHYRRAAHAA